MFGSWGVNDCDCTDCNGTRSIGKCLRAEVLSSFPLFLLCAYCASHVDETLKKVGHGGCASGTAQFYCNAAYCRAHCNTPHTPHAPRTHRPAGSCCVPAAMVVLTKVLAPR